MTWNKKFENLPKLGTICVVITPEKQIYLCIFMSNGEGAFFVKDPKTGEYVVPEYWLELPSMMELQFPEPMESKIEDFKPVEEPRVETIDA